MIRSKFEIRVIEKSTIQLLKKYSTKTEAIRMYESIPKTHRKHNFPELQLNQINYNIEGDVVETVTIKKNRVNIGKITIENLKNIL